MELFSVGGTVSKRTPGIMASSGLTNPGEERSMEHIQDLWFGLVRVL